MYFFVLFGTLFAFGIFATWFIRNFTVRCPNCGSTEHAVVGVMRDHLSGRTVATYWCNSCRGNFQRSNF